MADSTSRSGIAYTTPAIVDYVNRVHAGHDTGLANAFAVPAFMPAIQVGPSEGKLLFVIMKLIGARKIVEVGTLAGYSAIHMARGLSTGGHVWSIEFEPSHADVARANVANAGLTDVVTIEVGAGLDVLPELVRHGPFDAVFIDADKINYAHYGRWALDNVRSGGLVIGDNAYLFGELVDDSERGAAMREFHELVAAACDSVCVPTPDGLVIGVKK